MKEKYITIYAIMPNEIYKTIGRRGLNGRNKITKVSS